MARRSASDALNAMKIDLKNDGSFPMACGLTVMGSKAVALMEELGLTALPAQARKIKGDNAPTNNKQDWMKAAQANAANSADSPLSSKAANLTSAPSKAAPKPPAA